MPNITVGDYGNANVAAFLPVYGGDGAFANITTGTLFSPIQNNITAVGTLTALNVAQKITSNANIETTASFVTSNGNIIATVGNLLIGGQIVANAQIFSGANITTTQTFVGQSVDIAGNIVTGGILTDGYYYANGMPFAGGGGGNVDLGNVAQNILPTANTTYNIGNLTNQWNSVYANTFVIPNMGSIVTDSGYNVLAANINIDGGNAFVSYNTTDVIIDGGFA